MESFHTFVATRSAALMHTAFLLTGDPHRAEDLLQETLMRAADRWSRITDGGDPEPYVRRILHTRSIDGWRRQRVRDLAAQAVRISSDRARMPALLDEVASRLVLQEALMRLTARQRAVLVLRFYDDLTAQQTAVELGCTVSTVKSQTRHALARLRILAPDLLAELDPMETT